MKRRQYIRSPFRLHDMIVLGTPRVTLDFSIPDWMVLLIIGLMVLSYNVGKHQGIKSTERELHNEEEE